MTTHITKIAKMMDNTATDWGDMSLHPAFYGNSYELNYETLDVPYNIVITLTEDPSPFYPNAVIFNTAFVYKGQTYKVSYAAYLAEKVLDVEECHYYVSKNISMSAKDKFDWEPEVTEYLEKELLRLLKNIMPQVNDATDSVTESVGTKAKRLPGMTTVVPCPGGEYANSFGDTYECIKKHQLMDIIIHLNDTHKWTRERIAEWIDELHEQGVINAEFEPWNEKEST